MVKYFTIYGERCSGTNFLLHAIQDNFELEFTDKYAWKHFFGHYNFKKSEEENETLFIGIVREPIEWIDSFYKKMHHVPDENRENIHTFLFNKFYSIYEDTYTEIMEDRHMITKERYANIFELRNLKNNYLISEMHKNVKNYLLIRYEDLRDRYSSVLDFLKFKFNLTKKYDIYKTIESYKGNNKIIYYKKEIQLNARIIKRIKKNVDKEQEKSLGYLQ